MNKLKHTKSIQATKENKTKTKMTTKTTKLINPTPQNNKHEAENCNSKMN